jgi:hypothetical protein
MPKKKEQNSNTPDQTRPRPVKQGVCKEAALTYVMQAIALAIGPVPAKAQQPIARHLMREHAARSL